MFTVKNMYEYILKRSERKTLSLEVNRNCEIIVRAPIKYPLKKINIFVEEHTSWIEKSISKVSQKAGEKELTQQQISFLKKEAREYLPSKTEYYAKIMGVQYSGVKITSAKTRFGSCSGKNSICYSFYLMQKPLEAVDYVIVHELAHTVHHNHGKEFYRLIEKYMPDYKERNKLLKL